MSDEPTINSTDMIRKYLEEIGLYTELLSHVKENANISIKALQAMGSNIASASRSIEYHLEKLEAEQNPLTLTDKQTPSRG